MPADRSLAEDLAQPLLEIYSGLEARLTADMARRLRADLGRDDWAERKAQAAGEIANLIRRLLAKLAADLDGRVAQQLTLAYARGGHNALNELTNLALRPGRHEGLPSAAEAMMRAPDVQLGEMRRIAAGHHSNVIRGLNNLRSSYPGADSVMRMTWSLSSRLKGTHLPVLRWSEDAYRQTIAAAALPDVLLGVATRRRASQVAWEDLLSKGITGFVDNADRRWNLATYVEMATRTGVAQAAVEGHMDRLEGAGIDLVIVSNAHMECHRCLLPGTIVSGPEPTWRSRAEHAGDIVRITTASGKHLAGTPNHPVLTPNGWRRLDQISPGDQVVSDTGQQIVPGVMPDDVQVPTVVEKAGETRAPLLLPGPSRCHLDSDSADGEVHAKLPDGYLLSVLDAPDIEPLRELLLVLRIGTSPQFLGLCDLLLVLRAERDTTGCLMCWREHAGTLLGGGVLPPLEHDLGYGRRALLMRQLGLVGDDAVGARPGLDPGAPQVVAHAPAADAEDGGELFRALTGPVAADEFGGLRDVKRPRSLALADGPFAARGQDLDGPAMADAIGCPELLQGFAGTVSLDEVVGVHVEHYSGHVWDLSTAPGWFLANGIVTHNCRPWEGKVLTRTGPPGARDVEVEHSTEDGRMVTVHIAGSVDEAIGKGLMHPQCFPGHVLVSAPSGIRAADARWYEGDLVVVHTAAGHELPVTPNHPVLTPEGWVAAGLLQIGQDVLSYSVNHQRMMPFDASMRPGDEQVPTPIGEVFDALRQAGPVPPMRVPAAPEQFHGDGCCGDVEVVLAHGLLGGGVDTQLGESLDNDRLFEGGPGLAPLLADGSPFEVLDGPFHPAHSLVGGGRLRSALFLAHKSPLAPFSLAAVGAVTTSQQRGADGWLGTSYAGGDIALRHAVEMQPNGLFDPTVHLQRSGPASLGSRAHNASLAQALIDPSGADVEGGRHLARRLASEVTADQVIKIDVRDFAGHVYNLQSGAGWYVAQGIVVHNCRHSLSAYLPGLTRPITNTEDPEGEDAREHLRALEREIRRAKVARDALIDPTEKAHHAAKVAELQEQIRVHVAEFEHLGLFRKPWREQPDLGNSEPPGVGEPERKPRPTPPTMPDPTDQPVVVQEDTRTQPAGHDLPKPLAPTGPPPPEIEVRQADAAQNADALTAAPARIGTKKDPLPGAVGLTPAQQREAYRGLLDYKGPSYVAINGWLRGGMRERFSAAEIEAARPDAERRIAAIDLGMLASPLARDVMVYRGVFAARDLFGDRATGDLTGHEWVEQSYVSTSAMESLGRQFARNNPSGGVLLRILVPRGVHGVTLSAYGGKEGELLLQRGLRLRVAVDRGIVDGVRVLEVEVLP